MSFQKPEAVSLKPGRWTYALSALAILGSILNVLGHGSCFLVWTFANVGWLGWAVRRRHWPQVMIWSAFLATSVWGLILWQSAAPGKGPGSAAHLQDQDTLSRAGGAASHVAQPAAPAVLEPARGRHSATPPNERVEQLLDAIRRWESHGNDRAIGDGGRSLGAYQIGYLYYMDAVEQLHREGASPATGSGGRRDRVSRAEWRADVVSASVARPLVRAYWRRYCPEALEAGNLETLARVHNGGPDGAGQACTASYWQHVRETMEGRRGLLIQDRGGG